MNYQKGYLFHNRYKLVEPLGEGASAQVWKAQDTKANNLLVALKIFSQNKDLDSYGLQNFEKEFTTVYNMRHSNLLPPTGYDIFQGQPYLVMQYCENGSCNSMVGRMEEEDIIKLLHDVSAGLEYLHDHNIIHQDIKPDNILLDDNCNYMVTDFGISVVSENSAADTTAASGGTRAYMGPERFSGHTVAASDMWSLGATAVEMLTGDPPFGEHGGVLQAEGEAMPELPEKLQPEVKSMITACLEADPNKRIKANEIRQKIELYWETGSWVKPSSKKTIAIVATSVISILMCLGIFIWDYNRIKVHYYKDYTECWGVPKGIGKISSSQAKHMHRMYRFEYTKGKVRRVTHVNSLGNIIEDNESERNERPLDQEITYSSEGKVSRIKVKDKNGKVLYVKAFNENLSTMSFQYDDKHNTERALASNTVGYERMLEDDTAQKGKITRWWIEYDEEGHATTIRYAGLDNSRVGDDNNIYGRKIVYKDNGLISEIHYIGKDDEPKSTKWGLGIKKFYYDDNDNWIKVAYFTIDNQPSYDYSDGVSIYELIYDDNGNVSEYYHKDGDGSIMIPKKYGVAGVRYEYDDKGFFTKETYLGTDKHPMYVTRVGAAGNLVECDANGYVAKLTNFDVDEKPCETVEGIYKQVVVNDDKGNQLEVWAYGLDNKLCISSHSYAGTVSKYDSIGNLSEVVFYGVDKKPCLNNEGVAGIRYEYDERNLQTKIIFLATNLKPGFNNNHICTVHQEYDKRGNITKISFYNESGRKLVDSYENVAGWNMKYDDLGNEVERDFFNTENEPCEIAGGYAKRTWTYDQHGYLQAERYYGRTGQLVLVGDRAGNDYVCDERGNIIVNKPIGINGKLAVNNLEIHYKYDKFDNCTETSYFDNGKAKSNSFGVHKILNKYNTRNQNIEVRYYNESGNLTLTKNEGIAMQKNEFDTKGNRVRTYFYGTDEKPIKGKEGWAMSTYEYDVFGNVIKQYFYAVDGKPVSIKDMVPVSICKYDKFNNMIYLACQDGNGKFIINPNTGWAISRMEYDNKSQLMWQAYYDENDKPIKSQDGYHKVTYRYDNNHNQTERAYFGTDSKATLVYGIHKEKYKYNEKGLAVEYSLYDQNGKPSNCTGGFQRTIVTYDENNNPTIRKHYATNGTLLSTQTYNKNTGEWHTTSANTQALMNYSYSASSENWMHRVEEVSKECPAKIEDGVLVQSCTHTNNSVTIHIKLYEMSKYDLDDSQKETFNSSAEQFCDIFRKALSLPSSISMIVIVVDKADRVILKQEKRT